MEEKAQVNIEYLLILVGAVAVVTVVSLYIKSVAGVVINTGQQTANNQP